MALFNIMKNINEIHICQKDNVELNPTKIIVNVQTAIELLKLSMFVPNNNATLSGSHEEIYKIGLLCNIPVYCDPKQTWDNNSILINV